MSSEKKVNEMKKAIWMIIALMLITTVAAANYKPYRADQTEMNRINDGNLRTGQNISWYAAIYYINDNKNVWHVKANRNYEFRIPKQCYQYNPVNQQRFISVFIDNNVLGCTHAADEWSTILKTTKSAFYYEEWMK